MKLVPNAKSILTKAWSMWAFYASVFFAMLDAAQPGIAALLPELSDMVPGAAYRFLSLTCGILIPVMRVLDQGIEAGKQAAKEVQ